MSEAVSDAPQHMSADDRKAVLARAVATDVRSGWHVQSQTDYQAVLLKPGTKVNHVLHLILTLITLGIWAIVWILVALTHRRDRHRVVSVDPYGHLLLG